VCTNIKYEHGISARASEQFRAGFVHVYEGHDTWPIKHAKINYTSINGPFVSLITQSHVWTICFSEKQLPQFALRGALYSHRRHGLKP
jgi:hypothetical protein